MNINEYVPFLINTLETIVSWVITADCAVTISRGLPSSRPWQVLYFVNAIKNSISFSTFVWFISHSVTFCLVTTPTICP